MSPARSSLLGLAAILASLVTATAAKAYDLAGGAENSKLQALSTAIADVAKRQAALADGQSLAPLSTEGFVENARLLRDGQADFALIDSIATYWIGNADGPFAGETAFDGLRVVATLWYDIDHFVVSRSALQSGTIADFGDLTGARVSLSDESATEINSNQEILSALGGAVDARVDLDAVSGPTSIQRLDYEQIQGVAVTAPSPSAAVADAIAAMPDGGALVGLTSGQFSSLPGSRLGAWSAFSIPADTYPGQDTEIDTTARPIMLVARADVSEDDIYEITRSVFSNLPALAEESELAERISLENAVPADLLFPLHPGAARYYQEIGLITGDEVFARLQSSQDPLALRDSTIDPWKAYGPVQSIVFSGTPESERSRTFVSYFGFNSVDLDEPAAATVEEIAAFGKSVGNAEIFVAGHTDRSGSSEINELVAQRRADSVVTRLVELGYDETLISAEGFGEARPAVSTGDDEEHLQNRRVEAIVTLPAGATPVVASLENGTADTSEEPVNGTAATEATETPEPAPAAVEAEPSAPAAEDTTVAAVDTADEELPKLLVEQTVGKESDDLNLELRLSAPSTLPVVLIVTRLNGTALAGSDFENSPSVLTLKPGETSVQLKTVLINDDIAEDDETFSLKVSGSRDHVDIPSEPFTITIEDDD